MSYEANRMRFEKIKCQEIAQELLGMEYKMGGRGKDKKIDCYGILCYFFDCFAVRLPDYSYIENWDDKEEHYLKEYSSMFRRLEEKEKPEPGDVILFRNMEGASNHAGVYIGDGEFIHSIRKIGTKISRLRERPWKEKQNGFYRLKKEERE